MAWGYKKMRTEHAGGKNGGGFWGHRHEAKEASDIRRRARDKELERGAWEGDFEDAGDAGRPLDDRAVA